jgi:hypothetical protein
MENTISWWVPLIGFLLIGINVSLLVLVFKPRPIKAWEKMSFNTGVVASLLWGLIVGFFWGLVGYLIEGPSVGFGGIFDNLVGFLVVGLIWGLFWGFVTGFFSGLLNLK